MDRTTEPFKPNGILLLLRIKAQSIRNMLTQGVNDSPFKVLSAVCVVAVIWAGLYTLFQMVFNILRNETFQGIVAIPLILDFFFVALLVMLAFSNGVIAYGALFARGEPSYLLSYPLSPNTVTLLKLVESLVLSSWSLILVGLPLMFALASVEHYLPIYYYPAFGLFFICFIPIPAAAGVVVAWAVGYWLSRITKRLLILIGAVLVLAGAMWAASLWRADAMDSGLWLSRFFERASLMQGVLWPSTWVSKGLAAVRNAEFDQAGFYLLVTFMNAVFGCWLAVRIVGPRLLPAYDRVQARGNRDMYDGKTTRGMAGFLFWYLPDDMREVALKDLRSFLRDPVQWSQQLVLLGLLGLYVLNIQNVPLRLSAFKLQLLISFLNLAAISLLLATFTSRFVFPLITLEVQQLWLIGMIPVSRGRLLWPKFAFALTVTFVAGGIVMVLAGQAGKASVNLVLINLTAIWSICVGLSGLAVGLGGRFPMVGERSAARIASGIGGTINLAASLALVAILLVICFIIGARFYQIGAVTTDATTLGLLVVLVGLSTGVAAWAMKLGQKHFGRMEY